MASMTDAEKAAAHSKAHQKWILDTLQTNNGKCSYEKLVEVGEEHQCDTVGAMLKILKNRKLIHFKQMFLMYPMHKDEIVTLLNSDNSGSGNNSDTSISEKKATAKKPAPKPTIKFAIGTEIIADKGTRSACHGIITKIPELNNDRYSIKFYGWKTGKTEIYSANHLVKATKSEIEKRKETEKEITNAALSSNTDGAVVPNLISLQVSEENQAKKYIGTNSANVVFYTHEQLKHPGPFPDGVDVTKRETYLSPEDCVKLFGMTKEELAKMPKWKRNNLKKKVQLF